MNPLTNPLIISSILDHLRPSSDYLTYRLLNKQWKEETERKLDKTKWHFSVGPYMEQIGVSTSLKIPWDSPITKRVFIKSRNCNNADQFLCFLREHSNTSGITLDMEGEYVDECITDFGHSLIFAFGSNYCPNLVELYISGGEKVLPELTYKRQFSLPNLKTFHIRQGCNTVFLNIAYQIVKKAANLEELWTDSSKFFPDFSGNKKLINLYIRATNLREVDVEMLENTLKSCATNLEELILNIGKEFHCQQRTFFLPEMPRLRKLTLTDFTVNPFPVKDGDVDFIRFLNNCLPELEVLEFLEFTLSLQDADPVKYNAISKAISNSWCTNSKLRELRIPAPKDIDLISSCKEKFTKLKKFTISSNFQISRNNYADYLKELGRKVAKLKFKVGVMLSSKYILNIDDSEIEKEIEETEGFKGKVSTSFRQELIPKKHSPAKLNEKFVLWGGSEVTILQVEN